VARLQAVFPGQSRTVKRLTLVCIAIIALAPAAATAGSDPDGYRLAGRYKVFHKSKALKSRIWRLTPRCDTGACDTDITSTTGFDGTFRYRVSAAKYVLTTRSKSGACETSDGRRVEPAYVDTITIELTDFTGATGPAKYANGTRDDLYQPVSKAKALGCTKPHERSTKIHLRHF
jgi:hypothetical protein